MTTTETKQICTIRIMFPVDSDDEGIAIKKKISDTLTEIPESIIRFGLDPMPPTRPTVPNHG